MERKTLLITGASRGIGLAIGLRFAKAGNNIVIAAKEDPASPESALTSAAAQITAAGGEVLAFNIDLRDDEGIKQTAEKAIDKFGCIDLLINNTSAFCFNNTPHISPAQFDMLMATNVRATFFMSQACLPYLQQTQNPHIINISPPLHMDAKWFKEHLAFTISKYGMSLCTLGMAAEFQHLGVAVNSLWPQTTIATSTIKDHFLPQVYAGSRWPSIMADAAYELAKRPSRECTGQFFTDEFLLKESGMVDFSHYAVDPDAELIQDLFISSNSSEMSPLSQNLFKNSLPSCQ